ncbi:aldo/keto reductase [Butyrivibrio sp. TB]|nr:aldo/keto reductase [Butyrivibrio sp. TB]
MGAWKALENAVDEGKVRSIGISNFDEARTLNISNIKYLKNLVDI